MMSAIYYQMVQQKPKKSHTHWGRRVDSVAERRKEKINGVKGMWWIKCIQLVFSFSVRLTFFKIKVGEESKRN